MSPAVDRSVGKAEVKGEDEVERVLRVVVERHRKKKEAAAEVAKRIAADARDLSALRRLSADPTSTERLSIPAKFFSRLAKQLSKEEDLPTQQAEEEEEAEAAGATKKKSKKQQQAAEQPTEQQQQQQDQPLKKAKKSKKESTEDNNNNNNNNDEDNTASKKRKREQPSAEQPKKAKPSGKQGGGVQKQFYQPTKATLSMTATQVDDFRRAHNVTLTGNDVASFKPILSFADSTFSSQLLACCKDFAAPTTIQSECWPVILSGRDIIGVAATGSGKTIAFVLPSLVHIMAQRPVSPSDRGPVALVLAPTRELACQIDQVYASCTPSTGMRSVCVYGGVPKNEQRKALRSGVEVVVGTPGRVQDLIQEGSLSTSRVTFLVLDEADRMLDLGFEEPIKFIVGSICPVGERQTVMFSATWPKAIQDLAAQYFSDPVKVTIGSQELAACKSVTQKVEVIEPFAKDQRLDALLRQYHKSRKNRVLVFVLYKKEAVRVESMLMRKGWTAVAIHGDLSQYARTEAISKFKDGTCPLLIATDVAARGLDIPDVEYVINYSFPLTIEDYIHRIGRTGRAGKTGLSHTFFTSFDKARAGELVNILKEANQEVPADLEKFGPTISKRKEHAMYGAHYKPLEGVSAKATHIKFD